MRMFFALWPDETARRALAERVRANVIASGGRAIPWQNFHITLTFLGNVDIQWLDSVLKSGASLAGAKMSTVHLDRLEAWKRSRVLTLTGDCSASLGEFVRSLHLKLDNVLGGQLESRREEYRPHITLARDIKHRARSEGIEPLTWQPHEFTLVESKTTPRGSEYSVVQRWPLMRVD